MKKKDNSQEPRDTGKGRITFGAWVCSESDGSLGTEIVIYFPSA